MMLSSLWNQIASPDSDPEDDDTFPSKTAPLHEDDIAAASLLTAFPSYGSNRKPSALDSDMHGPSGAAGDWEYSPRRRVRRKNIDSGPGGLFGSDDFSLTNSADDISFSPSTGTEKKNEYASGGNNGDAAIIWSEDESKIWSEVSKKKSRKSKKGRHRKDDNAESIYFNSALRRQWLQGKNVSSAPGANAGSRQESKDKELTKRPSKRHHFTFEDDVTIGTDSISSDDDQSSAIVKCDSASSSLLKEHLDEKSHWMPDVLCKTCYACEAQFTVFRRRHHCRLCGQVFCSRCSSFFVEIVGGRVNNNQLEEQNNQVDVRTIRTCKVCHEQVSATGPNGFSFYNNGTQEEERAGQPTLNGKDSKETGVGSIRSFSQIKDSASSSQPGFQGGSSSDFFNLALVKQKLEETRVRREEEERASAVETKETKNPNPIKSITRRFGRLAETAARDQSFQVGDTGYNDEETIVKLVGTGVRNTEESEISLSPKSNKSSKLLSEGLRDEKLCAPSKDKKESYKKSVKAANRRLRLAAADYLEHMGRELMRSDAPTLLSELGIKDGRGPIFEKWVSKLMVLSSRACSSVKVDIRNGDALDILPYCKVKSIPGGSLKDSVIISGVVFHKNVSHKSMSRGISNARIMLLSGGIDYTRAEHKIASLNTLLEQEAKYLQILVAKITKIKPDVLIVGRSVSRRAQELLLETNIVLIQHVKPSLMDRIARQTNATVLSSTDHVMNQFGTNILGKCRRFRLVSFRDNDVWNNTYEMPNLEAELQNSQSLIGNINDSKHVKSLLANANLSNPQRQSILAASLLGEKVHDGSKAVKSGISKRGVAQTYVMIEGCPSHLGCTIVLRGASRLALKEVKRILKFLINVAYNLKLETSYLICRSAMLPTNCDLSARPPMSSSLCIDYGFPPQGRKTVRPWNGGIADHSQRSLSGKVTALEHQSILISSVWMAGKTQCCPAEVKGICYYSQQDVSLGMFLRDSCFDLTLKCQNENCKKSVLEHNLSFVHKDGLINITVEEMDRPIVVPTTAHENKSAGHLEGKDENKERIVTWEYCKNCKRVVTPVSYIDEETYNFSFGKFLEVSFYNTSCIMNSPECQCELQGQSILHFGCGNLAARFTYERIRPYGVYLRKSLPFDESFHKKFTVLELNEIMVSSSDLFERFNKHIETTSRETRDLFVSAVNKSENLQAVLAELHAINKEVVYASGVLKSKIVSVTNRYNTFTQDTEAGYSHGEVGHTANDAFSHFPWYARRYLFMLTSAWNERLAAIGQALSAMKKVVSVSQKLSIGSRSDIGIPQGVGADGELDEVLEAMQRLKEIREIYSDFNIGDMDIQSNFGGLPDKRKLEENDDIEDEDFNNDLPGSTDTDELAINFSEEVDADVLASRRRRSARTIDSSSSRLSRRGTTDEDSQKRTTKKPPRRRSKERAAPYSSQVTSRDSFPSSMSSRSPSPSPQQKAKAVSAGGAVKSAINRLFNRGGKEHNLYTVNLGIFNQGRPKLEPGVGGVVVPVFDGQPSTIIAHSLASVDYESQFRRHTRSYLKESGSNRRSNTTDSVIEDFLAGPGGLEPQKLKKYDSRSSRRGRSEYRKHAAGQSSSASKSTNDKADVEKRMLVRNKTHIKHAFRDYDEKGTQIAKFVCTTFWSTQFQAVRQAFLKETSTLNAGFTYGKNIIEKNFVRSLSASLSFAAVGGKSGASFSKTADDRFIVKSISRTELQMFLDCAPAYFEYLSKAFFHGLPTMLCKIVGVYQIGYHNRETGKRTNEQVAVMQNIFYGRNVSKIFDLKGSLKGRFAKLLKQNKENSEARSGPSPPTIPKRKSTTYGSDSDVSSDEDGDQPPTDSTFDDEEGMRDGFSSPSSSTLLDGDFLEFTAGRPLPLTDRGKAAFHMSILNDTLFLSMINVLDYSILVGIDEDKNELVVGIIDFMRQYDILKQMERVGKSLPMVVGSEAPTIIQPPLYKARFITAMERYFMTVPNKWTTI